MRNVFLILVAVAQIAALSFFVLPDDVNIVLGAVKALQTAQGGTGTTTIPTTGQVLVGQSNGTYAPQATSTLGITGGSGTNYLTNSGSNTFLNTGTNLQAPKFEATSTTASVFTYASTTAVSASRFWGPLTGNVTGTASLATALAANGANCTVTGQVPLGVDASGAAESCTGVVLGSTTTLPLITTLSNLATVGTITSGTWNGTTIAIANGGTNATSFGSHMLTAYNGTAMVSTSTPTVGAVNATNTNATSTFAGAVQIGSTAGDNLLRIAAARSHSSSDSVGGLVRLTNTLNAGSAFGIYSNFGAGGTNDLMVVQSDNTAYARRAFRIKQDGTGGAGLFDCLTTAGVNECLNITSSDLDTTALGVSGATDDHGVIKVTAVDGDGIDGNASNANAALISGVLNDASQGIYFTASSTGLGSSTGKLLNFNNYGNQNVFSVLATGVLGQWDATPDAMIETVATSGLHYLFLSSTATMDGDVFSVLNNGNVGIGTTSPYARLSVNGQTVASHFTATSTTATSTLPWLTSARLAITEIFQVLTNLIVCQSTTCTYTGTHNMSAATVKMHKYPSFTWPAGTANATTTTATTTIPLGTAFVANTFNTGECWSGSGTIQYQISDGTNKTTTNAATTTVSRLAIATNNTFSAGEKRFIELGPMTAAYISCSFDVTEN